MNTRTRDYGFPSTMQFGEFGGHLVHQTTSDTGIDVVCYEGNKTQRRGGRFPFKMQQSSRETMVPGSQTKVAVAPKRPSLYFHFGRRRVGQDGGSKHDATAAKPLPMVMPMAQTSHEQANFASCTSSTVVD